jgi:hypothetical protein
MASIANTDDIAIANSGDRTGTKVELSKKTLLPSGYRIIS